jgi:transposase
VGSRRLPSSVATARVRSARGRPVDRAGATETDGPRPRLGADYGKSDPIDALAVARAAQREPGLAVARLDGPDRDVRLLTDHRESLVNERTRLICRLRWFLHELDPSWEPKARSLDRIAALEQVAGRIVEADGTVARLARELVERIRSLTADIDQLTKEIAALVTGMAPTLLAVPGCGALTAAKILGETAGVDRFKSKDAYARHNGTAPTPVWSSNRPRHRLSRCLGTASSTRRCTAWR